MRVFSFFLCAVALLAAPLVQADDSAALQRFYQEVDSLSAHFEQQQLAEDGAVLRESSGIFLLSRPGKFRWEYDQPYRQIIVSDGDVLKFYDVGLAQVTIRAASGTLSSTPALLLTGSVDLQQAFVVEEAGRRDGLAWLRLTPRSEHSDFKEIRLGLDAGLPAAMELDDQLGQTTHIRFFDIEVNPFLPAARFELVVPDGVTVVDAREQDTQQLR